MWVAILLLVLLSALVAQQASQVEVRPQRLPQDTGTAGLNQALKKLKTTARLLQTTAHPDDEDGAMLAYESRGQGAEVMLLTLTRGDGGQNKTGSNLFDELGVLRTLELLESDRYYGVQQRFSRVADFGFTKSADETFQKWGGHDVALADMVRVIRTFRPDVVAAGWSGTSRDGHGQHQAAGILTPEAVAAAADPKRFPEQIKEGLLPWRVKKLYARTRGDDYTLRLEGGKVDPNLGTSYAQFGIEGYSHQKSQNASFFPAQPGPNYRRYKLVESTVSSASAGSEEKDFFDGIDTTLPGLASRLGKEESKVPFLRAALKEIDSDVDEATSTRAAAPLLAGWNKLQPLLFQLWDSSLTKEAKEELLQQLLRKSEQFVEAMRLVKGIDLQVVREGGSQLVVPGQTIRLNARFVNQGKTPVTLFSILLDLPRGWTELASSGDRTQIVKPGESATVEFSVSVPADAQLTRPYWHRDEPDKQNLHTINNPEFVTLPFPPPPVTARAWYEEVGIAVNAGAGAQVDGKFTPLAVVPAFSVLMKNATRVVQAGNGSPFTASVIVRSNRDQKSNGTVRLSVPEGWKAEPQSQKVGFERNGEEKVVAFTVTPLAAKEARTAIRAELESGGKKYSEGFSVVTRADLDTFYYYQPSVQKISVVQVELPKNIKLGYIMGAGDDIPAALEQLGLDIHVITPEELASGDLSRFNTIVLGIRAYDTRDDLRAHNRRLLDFVSQGGTLIVQNNSDTEEFNGGGYSPFPLQISRQRVSVEESPVEILRPEDAIFNFPNKITGRDFDGWIQERGLYFPSQWDDKYQALLASADPGETPLRGGLLRAAYGKGTYIYTGYAFFRQIPAGVPGAIRLYVNLLSAGQTGSGKSTGAPFKPSFGLSGVVLADHHNH